jgi:hypothetical protein
MGAEPGADQDFKNRVPHMGQPDGTDGLELSGGKDGLKIVFHKSLPAFTGSSGKVYHTFPPLSPQVFRPPLLFRADIAGLPMPFVKKPEQAVISFKITA